MYAVWSEEMIKRSGESISENQIEMNKGDNEVKLQTNS